MFHSDEILPQKEKEVLHKLLYSMKVLRLKEQWEAIVPMGIKKRPTGNYM
jgi:hypothetical protein